MASAGNLKVSLTAEHAEFIKAMHEAAQATSKLTIAMGVGIERAVEFGLHLAKEGASGLYEFGKAGFEALDKMGKLSDKIGMSATFLSTMQGQIKSTGGDVEGFNTSLEHLVKNLGHVGQNKEIQETLRRLHIPLNELRHMNAEQAFRKIADSIKDMKSPTEQVAMAQELFGKNWMSVIGVLRQGSAGVDEANTRLTEMGAVFDDMDVSKIQVASESVDELGVMASAAGESLAEEFAPILHEIVEATIHWIKVNGGLKAVVHDVFEFMVKGAGWVADAVEGLLAVWNGMKTAIFGLFWIMVQPMKNMIDLIDLMAHKFEDLVNAMIHIWNKFGKHIDDVKFTGTLDEVKSFADSFSDELGKAADEAFTSSGRHLTNMLEGTGSAAVKEWVDGAIESTDKLAEHMAAQKKTREKAEIGHAAAAMGTHQDTTMKFLSTFSLGSAGAVNMEHRTNPELTVLQSIDKTLKQANKPKPAYGLGGI